MPQLDPETGVAAPMCCDVAATSDFDVSADNATWYTGFALVRPSAFLPAWKGRRSGLKKGAAVHFGKCGLESAAVQSTLKAFKDVQNKLLGRRRRRGWG